MDILLQNWEIIQTLIFAILTGVVAKKEKK
jgi:hypothetical protein